jgi:hypothetical protein
MVVPPENALPGLVVEPPGDVESDGAVDVFNEEVEDPELNEELEEEVLRVDERLGTDENEATEELREEILPAEDWEIIEEKEVDEGNADEKLPVVTDAVDEFKRVEDNTPVVGTFVEDGRETEGDKTLKALEVEEF